MRAQKATAPRGDSLEFRHRLVPKKQGRSVAGMRGLRCTE
jgi:hypothetical protein